jgi:hypothetical protein
MKWRPELLESFGVIYNMQGALFHLLVNPTNLFSDNAETDNTSSL